MQSMMKIRLPFRLAMPSKQQFLSGYEEGPRKWRNRIIFEEQDLTIVGDDDFREPLYATVATIWTDINFEEVLTEKDFSGPATQPYLKLLFLHTLDYLNQVIYAYRVVEQDYTVRAVTLTDLPFAVEMVVDGASYLYIVNAPHWSTKAEELREETLERMKRIGGMLGTRDRAPQYVNIQQFYASARHYLEQGQHSNAIIELGTAFELQARFALKLALDEQRVPEPRYSGAIGASLRNVIEELLPKYLGGNFSFKDPGPIADWHRHLYLPRNECVHEGRTFVLGDEVILAFDAYHAATDHIADRLVALGILSDKKEINLEKYAPRRNIELHSDEVMARYREIGWLDDNHANADDDKAGNTILDEKDQEG